MGQPRTATEFMSLTHLPIWRPNLPAVLLCLGMTVVKQVAVSIAVAVITVAVAEYVAWVLGQSAP
jgi:hypothetical protein